MYTKPPLIDGAPYVVHYDGRISRAMRKFVFAKPMTEMWSREVSHLIDERLGQYLSYMIGYKGCSSIVAYLRRKG